LLVVILLPTIAPAQNAPNKLLPIIVDGKYGFISAGGEVAIPARFQFAWDSFHEGLASAWTARYNGYGGAGGLTFRHVKGS